MANIWEKVISILAGNWNSGCSYLITAVTGNSIFISSFWTFRKILGLLKWNRLRLISIYERLNHNLSTFLIHEFWQFSTIFGRWFWILTIQKWTILVLTINVTKLAPQPKVSNWKFQIKFTVRVHNIGGPYL